jgi:cysteine desulfurase/selenocysteine lyase
MNSIRDHFPALRRTQNGKPIIFADNASTTLKPQCVIDKVNYFYTHLCSNVHRGENTLTQETSELFEKARLRVADFLNASPDEVIFVKNATEGINLASHLAGITQDSHVLNSIFEHHSNFLPWFQRAKVESVFPFRDGVFDIDLFKQKISRQTQLLAISHVSNVTGELFPVASLIDLAKKHKLLTLVDASQSISHFPINVRSLGCDFLVFSGHKIFGPSGVGVLFAKKEVLERATPWMLGGGMVDWVDLSGFAPQSGPAKFEAGTPNVEGILGLGSALAFIEEIGWSGIQENNSKLALHFWELLKKDSVISIHRLGQDCPAVPIFSLSVKGLSGSELVTLLCNRYNIMARYGAHCAEPLMRYWKLPGTVRFSMQVYNSIEEVNQIAAGINQIAQTLGLRR